ncbi:MAG: hypothetical protein WD689_07295 [Gaiellaceae bacterium]
MSVSEPRERPAEHVAGFLAAASLAVSLIGIVERPVRTIPVALVVGLIAVAMGGRHQRLAAAAVMVGALAFVVGMTVAIATEAPLW